jgi:hypothetical protein
MILLVEEEPLSRPPACSCCSSSFPARPSHDHRRQQHAPCTPMAAGTRVTFACTRTSARPARKRRVVLRARPAWERRRPRYLETSNRGVGVIAEAAGDDDRSRGQRRLQVRPASMGGSRRGR